MDKPEAKPPVLPWEFTVLDDRGGADSFALKLASLVGEKWEIVNFSVPHVEVDVQTRYVALLRRKRPTAAPSHQYKPGELSSHQAGDDDDENYGRRI